MHNRYIPLRPSLVGLFLAWAVLTTGCIQDKVLIHVNADGTGHILVTQVINRDAWDMILMQMDQMGRMQSGSGGKEKDTTPPLLRESFWKQQGRLFGNGVTFAQGKPVESPAGIGYVALYRFQKIDDVFIDLEKVGYSATRSLYDMDDLIDIMGDNDAEDEPVERGEHCYEFSLAAGTPNKLQVRIPDFSSMDDGGMDMFGEEEEDDADADADGKAEDPDEDDDEEDMGEFDYEMMMQYGGGYGYGNRAMFHRFVGVRNERDASDRMSRNTAIQIQVEVEGSDFKTTSRHPVPAASNRISLVNFDASALGNTPAGRKIRTRLQYGMHQLPQFLGQSATVPGIIVETNRTITVEFK